ncbi:hypothetical protein SVAN01_09596 [Stagonosporopsis vannaccii]|nr:hypothetical protein SVAN01_09596 [Stagonosporopsis vannaccii]
MGAWGYGLFQSDHDFDFLSELGHEMGLTKLEDDMRDVTKANGKGDEDINIFLSIYGGGSHPDIMVASASHGVHDPRPVLRLRSSRCLRPMTLGCHPPQRYIDMLKVVYTEGGLMPEACNQIRKTLSGPNGSQQGEPYDFECKRFVETANSEDDDADDQPICCRYKMMNVPGPGGIFNLGMGNSASSVVMKELRSKLHQPDVCAKCSAGHAHHGAVLLQCARCKDRKCCSPDCQKKHWVIHKMVCRSEKLGVLSA